MEETILFYILAILTGGSAIAMVASRNIVRTALFLLFALAGVAGLYFLLDAEFLAALQLVIYVGGILILIVFGVMLTSRSQFRRLEPGRGEVAIALAIGAILLGALVTAILNTPFHHGEKLAGEYPILGLGQALLGDYLIPFELVSVLLLVAMIGAAYLARRRR